MTLRRKASRTIVARGERYRWVVGAPRRASHFADEPDVVDRDWLAVAHRYGLGKVADLASLVTVEIGSRPTSRLVIRHVTKLVDGFLGPEQLASITPRLVRAAIERALDAGWRVGDVTHMAVEIETDAPAGARPRIVTIAEAGLAAPQGASNVVPLRRIR